MKVILTGAVDSTRVAMEELTAAGGVDLAAVVTLPLSLAHRHSDFVDLRPQAERAGVAVIEAKNCNDEAVIEAISAFGAELGFVIGWSQICGADFRRAVGGDLIGYHPAPLPRMRGRAAIPWTILLDEKITASSLFWVDEGVDSGDILAQEFLHVAPDETATTLYDRQLGALRKALKEALPKLVAGAAPRVPQDARFATWTARRTQADGVIDWGRSTEEVLRLIRAVTKPYPGAFSERAEGRIVIWSGEVWPEAARHAGQPGQVLQLGGDGFAVACGDGAVFVTDYTLEGGKPLKNHEVFGR